MFKKLLAQRYFASHPQEAEAPLPQVPLPVPVVAPADPLPALIPGPANPPATPAVAQVSPNLLGKEEALNHDETTLNAEVGSTSSSPEEKKGKAISLNSLDHALKEMERTWSSSPESALNVDKVQASLIGKYKAESPFSSTSTIHSPEEKKPIKRRKRGSKRNWSTSRKAPSAKKGKLTGSEDCSEPTLNCKENDLIGGIDKEVVNEGVATTEASDAKKGSSQAATPMAKPVRRTRRRDIDCNGSEDRVDPSYEKPSIGEVPEPVQRRRRGGKKDTASENAVDPSFSGEKEKGIAKSDEKPSFGKVSEPVQRRGRGGKKRDTASEDAGGSSVAQEAKQLEATETSTTAETPSSSEKEMVIHGGQTITAAHCVPHKANENSGQKDNGKKVPKLVINLATRKGYFLAPSNSAPSKSPTEISPIGPSTSSFLYNDKEKLEPKVASMDETKKLSCAPSTTLKIWKAAPENSKKTATCSAGSPLDRKTADDAIFKIPALPKAKTARKATGKVFEQKKDVTPTIPAAGPSERSSDDLEAAAWLCGLASAPPTPPFVSLLGPSPTEYEDIVWFNDPPIKMKVEWLPQVYTRDGILYYFEYELLGEDPWTLKNTERAIWNRAREFWGTERANDFDLKRWEGLPLGSRFDSKPEEETEMVIEKQSREPREPIEDDDILPDPICSLIGASYDLTFKNWESRL